MRRQHKPIKKQQRKSPSKEYIPRRLMKLADDKKAKTRQKCHDIMTKKSVDTDEEMW